ncbi:MAG: O-succinylhomoserine sulfhydrylase [Gammaproteobacteria bacterium]|nr:O-succinylhomoserine sulfhydrylase [Gammaproteobacteria bacterium]
MNFDPTKYPYADESLAIRAGQLRSPEREHNDPIHLTSSFVFGSAAEAAEGFADEAGGNIYSRFTNPTVRAFEQRLAALDGADYCTATASGMAAVMTLTLSTLKTGDHVIAANGMFGSITGWMNKYLKPLGIDISFCDLDDTASWAAAVRENTKLLFVESPTNPRMVIGDLSALAEIAHQNGAILAVDNCFATPALQKPIQFGADVVMHSTTKFIDGQGRCVGGALTTNNPSLHEKFFGFMRAGGPTMSAFNAWVFLNGLETLSLRVKTASANALELATWLAAHESVAEVRYPGLDSHPQHELAARQMQGGFGALITFRVKGGKAAAWRVIDGVEMISITGNFGDVKSTITHPASTTHARLSDQEREQAGIGEDLIRVCVGLEALEDIKRDLARGLGR